MIGASPLPRAGDVLRLDRNVSVQFVRPVTVRFIRIHDDQTPCVGAETGWRWLDVYELDRSGDAVDRRSIFIDVTAVRCLSPADARSID